MVNFAVVVAFGAVFLPVTLAVGVVPGECSVLVAYWIIGVNNFTRRGICSCREGLA